MKSVVLKGTKNGYELSLESSASLDDICSDLLTLLRQIEKEDAKTKQLNFDLLTGNRWLTDEQKKRIKDIFDKFDNFFIHRFVSDVMTKQHAAQLLDTNKVNVVYDVIRNGQEKTLHGDVLFLGVIHEGGKLLTDSNIYVMGNVNGILHAGFPSSESAMIIGDLSNAQQLRIGEQFDIVADKKIQKSSQLLAYVNELHVLSYSSLEHLKQINPKFYNRIGGINNG